ncbi:MAG: hypothetical protein LWX55_11555 [Deltaproteobacteria bacterium]|nr:hypothetical protein [Deltaproteobacteria bacterium]
MSDIASMRQPGRSSVFLLQGEYAGQPIIKEERQMGQGKSDGVIVPVKAGNSAGGKDVT